MKPWIAERDELLAGPWDAPMDHSQVNEPGPSYGEGARKGIVPQSRDFALRIITFTRTLRDAGWLGLSEQLFDAGTSIGANMNEAQQAESRADFLHKCRIAAKEAKESKFWLGLCRDAPELPYATGMWEECDALNAILATIIARTISNDPKRKKRGTTS